MSQGGKPQGNPAILPSPNGDSERGEATAAIPYSRAQGVQRAEVLERPRPSYSSLRHFSPHAHSPPPRPSVTGSARTGPEPTPLPSPPPVPHDRAAAKREKNGRRFLLRPVGLCRARPQSETAAAQPVLFPYRGSQPHSCCRLLLLPPTFFFFFSSSSPPRRLLTPPRRAPPPPPRRMMPSHSGIGGSGTTIPLPLLLLLLPLLLLPLPPPRAPNGRASLARAPRARGAGTCGAAAAAAATVAAARAGGPSRSQAVRSGGGRERGSLNRRSSKGTGLIPKRLPRVEPTRELWRGEELSGLNQPLRRKGRRGRAQR